MSNLTRGTLGIPYESQFTQVGINPDEHWEQRYQELRRAADPATLKEYIVRTGAETLGRGQVRLLQMAMDLPKVGHALINMRWGVLTISDVMLKFLTSDRPVIMTNGIGRDEGHVALTIGPRRLFLAARKQETIDRILNVPTCDLIMGVNTIVVQHAEKFVYGESDLAINFVEKYLR
jgi:hypothetical protein